MTEKFESSATKRARLQGYFEKGPEFYCEFTLDNQCIGLGQEENVNRRDPSAVIEVDGIYYTYYTYNEGSHVGFGSGDENAKVWPWDYSDIYYATSTDGINWREQGIAVARGEAGSFDDRSVFTPEILAHDGKYYLVYQAVKHPYVRRTFNTIAMSVADSPTGPFRKLKEPILEPEKDGQWAGESDNRFEVKSKGSFDSHKVHDPVLFHFKDKFFLYYKGEIMGEELYMGGRETKWGVAISDTPEGPYVKSPYNPVTNSGHETILWPYKEGMVAMLTTDGPERNTIQFSEDGVNFDIVSMIKGGPEAPGPYRPSLKTDESPFEGITWGLSHEVHKGWNYILRFDINNALRDKYVARITYN